MDKNDTTFGKFDTSNNTQPISETSSTISVGSTGSRINMNDNFNIISNATDGLRDTISSINNNHFHIEGFNEILSKLKDVDQKIEGLKNSQDTTNSNDIIQQMESAINNINTIKNEIITSVSKQVQEIVQTNKIQNTEDYDNIIQSVANSVSETTNKLSQLQNTLQETKQSVLDSTQQQIKETNDVAQVHTQAMNQATQDIKQTADSANTLSDAESRLFEEVQTTLANIEQGTGATSQLLDSVDELSKTAVESIDNQLIQSLQQFKNDVKNDISSDNFSENTLNNLRGLVGNAKSVMSAISSSLKANEDGSNLSHIRATQELNIKVANNVNNTLNQFASILEQQGNANSGIADIVKAIRQQLTAFNNDFKENNQSLISATNSAIQNAKNAFVTAQQNAIKPGTDEYNSVSNAMATQSLASISFNDLTTGANDALINLEYSQGKNNPWYQYVTTGNLLGNKTSLARGMENTQREGFLASSRYSDLVNNVMSGNWNNKQKAQGIAELAKVNVSMGQSVLDTAKGMNLHTGGGKNLNAEDKKVFEAFTKQVDNALGNLTKTINAIEDLDPENKSLKKLREEQKALLKLKQNADDAKESSSALSNIFSDIASGVSKLKNLLAGGLSMLGLGALLSPMVMLNKAIGYETQEGQRRYAVAMNDFSMGANLNQGRINYIARDKDFEYWKNTNGMIKEGEFLNHYKTLTQTVGGHYNTDPNANMEDMAQLTDNSFAWGKVFNVDAGTIGTFFKNTYKDLGMSASEATQAMVNVGQAATSAGIPVKAYMTMINNLSSNLINHGVSARQVMSSMNALINHSHLRPEDASSMITEMAGANEKMATDMNSSAFFGMMAGQGGSPFDLIVQGYKPYKANGRVDENYYPMMAQRVMAEANLMGGIGGDNALGGIMYIDTLMKRGFSQKNASMLQDAVSKGDMSLVQDILKKADEEKDGGKQAYTEAILDAKEKLKTAGDQVSIFQKLETDLSEAQKKLGWAINEYLSGPLAKFREGFAKILNTLVTTVGELMKAITDFMGKHKVGETVSDAVDTMSNHKVATGLGILGGATAAGAGVYGLKALGQKALKSSPSVVKNIAKAGSHLGGKGAIISGGMALVAGAALVGGAGLSALVSMFTTGEAKVQTNNNAEQDLSDVQTIVDNLQNSTGYSPDSDGALQPSESNTYAKEHTGDENSYYYGTGWSEDYSQIDPNLIDKKGNYNESLSNAEFINQSIAERYGDEIENYKIANPNDVYVDANTGEATEDWEQREKNLDKTTLINNAGLIAGGTIAVPGAAALAVAKKYNLINKDRWDALNNVAKKGKWWSRFAKLGKFGGPLGAGITLADEIINEFSDENSDNYSMGQHVARVAFRGGGAIAGGLAGAKLGALAGSLVGPAGTIVGGFLGGTAGALIGGFAGEGLQNSSVGDALGISDKSAIKTAHDSYAAKVKQSASLYGDATKSIVSSNDNRQKAAARALSEHGIKLEDLTNDQEQYINNVYNDLKSRGLADEVAAFVAGLAAGTVADKQKNDAEYAFNNDEISKGKGMKKTAEVAANEWMTDEQKEQGFESLDPNELSGHDTTWSLKLGGMYLEDGGKDNNLSIEEKKQRLSLLGQIMGGTNAGSGEDKIANAIMNDSDWTDIAGHLVSGPFRNGDRATIANIFQDSNLENFSDEDINKAYNMAYNEVAYVSSTQNEDAIKKNMESIVSTTPNPKDVGDKMQLNKPNPPDNPHQDTQQTTSQNKDQTLESTYADAEKNIMNMQKQIGELAGLKDKELLNDRVATGQLILDGSTALSSNGRMLSLRGLRDRFRAFSGVHDKDLFGVSLKNGAYSGDGKYLTNSGPSDIGKKMDKEQKVDFKAIKASSRYRMSTEGYDGALQKMAEQYKSDHEQQEKTYAENRKRQEELNKEKQQMEMASININNIVNNYFKNVPKPQANNTASEEERNQAQALKEA